MSLIKVAWYVLRVKNMHFRSPSDPSQIVARRGHTELRILDFKTTWSQFQKTSQTAAEQGEAELRILNFKTHGQTSQSPIRLLLREVKLS